MLTLANDGRPVGDIWRDTQLRVAHEIVRRVVNFSGVTEEEKRFAAAWYVALAASMARANDLAGLKDHLEEAREQFPRNAEIYFLSGCWAESVASPAVQSALPAADEKQGKAFLYSPRWSRPEFERQLTREVVDQVAGGGGRVRLLRPLPPGLAR